MTTAITSQIDTQRHGAQEIPLLADQFIDMAFITSFTGLTNKWFYKLIQDGQFPRPVKFGRSSRWLKSEVEAWVQGRIDDARAG